MKNIIINVEKGNYIESINNILIQMLETGFIDAIMAPKKTPAGDSYSQSLLRDRSLFDGINPFAPTMAVQTARLLSEITTGPLDKRIGVVLKPCELKATVELVKFLQINLDNIITIGVDCAGTLEVTDYKEIAQKKENTYYDALIKAAAGNVITSIDDYKIRECCQICSDPVPINPDISIGFYGYDLSKNILLTVSDKYSDEFKKELGEKLGLKHSDIDTGKRDTTVSKIKEDKTNARSKLFDELKSRTDSIEKLLNTLSTCIRCHNCMTVCPICYCKECVFKSAVFKHSPDQLLSRAKRNGAIRMPVDTLIFHLTRMSHMATSCVSCGMCESACPAGLPISNIFSSIGGDLQALFEYIPGKNVEEAPPVSTFKEEELEE